TRRRRKELERDLDRSVTSALPHDPAQLYRSLKHLEDDLLRYLQGKPIAARSASPIYTLRKLVQRNKTVMLAALAMVVLLSTSLLIYWSQSRKADRRVTQVRALAGEAISDLTDNLQHSSASSKT